MSRGHKDPLRGAAILRLSLEIKGMLAPGSQDSYGEILEGVISDLGLTHRQVEDYIAQHRQELEAVLKEKGLV